MARDSARYRQAEAALWASVGVAPLERWVRLRGGEYVRVQTVGEGPPVLLVHGGSSSGASWAPLVAGVDGFRLEVVDRPGCGLSDPVARGGEFVDIADIENFADGLVADILDGIEVDRAHLVATSLGGYFAMRGAAAHPERVDRIVEIAWPMGAPIEHVPVSMRVAAIPGLGAIMTKLPPTRSAVRMILKQIGLSRALEAGRIGDEFFEWFQALLRHTDTMANEIRANPRVVTPIGGMNERMVLSDDLIERIGAPVLFVWGGEDPMGGEAVARPFVGRFSDASVEMLPLAGHAPWIDEPEQCARLVRDFLAA